MPPPNAIGVELAAGRQSEISLPANHASWVSSQFFDRIALAVATAGVGYLPLIPATWASAVTVMVYGLLLTVVPLLQAKGILLQVGRTSPDTLRITCLLIFVISSLLVGIWAASRAERIFARKDPKPVVIDEVVGQLITFLFVPYTAHLATLVMGFFVFRAFDIFKPYPIRKLESFKGGLGIMADDVLAGLYGATVMLLLSYIPWFS